MKPAVLFTSLLVFCLASVANAQDGAGLAPHDARVFIQADGMAGWIDAWEKDPLYRYLKEVAPEKKHRDAMKELEAILGMSGHDIIRKYFGTKIIYIGKEEGDGKPGVLLSEVAKADMDHALDSIRAALVDTYGAYKIYTPEDGSVLLGYDGKRLAVAEPRFKDYAKAVLSRAADDKSLADDAAFKEWTGRLADDRAITVYVLKPDETHAIGVVKGVRGSLDIGYTGTFPDLRKLYPKLGDAEALEFGPLPKTTIGATMLNLEDAGIDTKGMRAIDGILANVSKNFKEDILPNLDAPLLLFLGEVSRTAVKPDPGFAVPVVGMAVKLRDTDVARDLNYVMGTAVALGNLSVMSWSKTPMTVKARTYNDVSYVAVDAGAALAAKVERPELAGTVVLSYGAVGDWFVVCTHEEFFKQIIAAEADESKRLTINKMIPVTDNDDPVLSSFTRMPLLSAHVATWVEYIKAKHPGLVESADADAGNTKITRAVKGLTVLSEVMDFYNGIGLQVKRESEDRVSATLTIQRR